MDILKDFYTNPDIKKAYQLGFNDGLQCAVDNAQEFEYINEEQAEELLTELVDLD
jgi:DNA-directed RNA polymerase subunit F